MANCVDELKRRPCWSIGGRAIGCDHVGRVVATAAVTLVDHGRLVNGVRRLRDRTGQATAVPFGCQRAWIVDGPTVSAVVRGLTGRVVLHRVADVQIVQWRW